MKLQFIGCGDAFGSGGRFNTCFHVTGEKANFLIDCGASSLIALKKQNVTLNDVDAIFITHFHADHFAGVPFFILNSQIASNRKQPLTLVGPQGMAERYESLIETMYSGASRLQLSFELHFVEVSPQTTTTVNGIDVQPFEVVHGLVGGPFLGYRLACEGRTIAFSGDTGWTDTLIELGRDSDLFICECNNYDVHTPFHLDWLTLQEKLPLIQPQRLILTHLGDKMLKKASTLECETAEDGKIITI